MSSEHPNSVPGSVTDRWDTLVADAEATAAEYREDGWEPFVLTTGDVTPLFDDPFGLDVLVPGSEFDQLQELIDSVSFETFHVYRAEADTARFFVIVLEGSDDEHAVIFPAFLSLEDAPRLEERAAAADAMYTHVRPLSDDAHVTFTFEDQSLFF